VKGRGVAVVRAVATVAVKLGAFGAEEVAVLAVVVPCQRVNERVTAPNVRKREDRTDGSTDSVIKGVTIAVGQCDGRALVNVFALVNAVSLEASVASTSERAVRVRAGPVTMARVGFTCALINVRARVGGVASPTGVANAVVRVHVACRAVDTSQTTIWGKEASVARAGERAVIVRASAVAGAVVCRTALVDVGARGGGIASPTGVADAVVRVHVARVTLSAYHRAIWGEEASVARAGERAVCVRACTVARTRVRTLGALVDVVATINAVACEASIAAAGERLLDVGTNSIVVTIVGSFGAFVDVLAVDTAPCVPSVAGAGKRAKNVAARGIVRARIDCSALVDVYTGADTVASEPRVAGA
jgi:hypothetical protein